MYWNAIEFTDFDQPRQMKLRRDTNRINAYTGEVVDTLKAGSVIHFSTKTVLDNTTYFRTTYNSDRNEPYVLSATDVGEV